jgi:hypothetical protein
MKIRLDFGNYLRDTTPGLGVQSQDEPSDVISLLSEDPKTPVFRVRTKSFLDLIPVNSPCLREPPGLRSLSPPA